MARWEKLLQAVLNDPKPRSYTYDDMVVILTRLGFTLASHGGGSHRRWHRQVADPTAPGGQRRVIIGFVDGGHGTVKPEYVKDMVRKLRQNNLLPKGYE